ncbi:MAG: hypothetical protein K6356_01185 [Chloroflexus sp.]
MKNGTIIYQVYNRFLITLCRWSVRGLAMLVVLELGILSPMSCVLHCLIQQWMNERVEPHVFLCNLLPTDHPDEHSTASTTVLQPRAVYETLAPPPPVLLAVIPLLIVLLTNPRYRIHSYTPRPPTPPPRRYLTLTI